MTKLENAMDDNAQRKIDPLDRIWIPIEKRTAKGTLVFRTSDRETYARLDDGSIRRVDKKARGKAARRAERAARRENRQTIVRLTGLEATGLVKDDARQPDAEEC